MSNFPYPERNIHIKTIRITRNTLRQWNTRHIEAGQSPVDFAPLEQKIVKTVLDFLKKHGLIKWRLSWLQGEKAGRVFLHGRVGQKQFHRYRLYRGQYRRVKSQDQRASDHADSSLVGYWSFKRARISTGRPIRLMIALALAITRDH